ncbi:hypothetical protein ABZ858_26670 [Streptomyces sp. NPDC047017]|uniref:hypothetical protein n=1 Tax=Streptomyces sp. NPDC047017 TaxID=3155024 RepID=UPI00340B69F5
MSTIKADTVPRAARVLGCAALAATALGLCGAGTAAAATPAPPAPAALSAAQLTAGRTAAGSDATLKVLDDFFAHAPRQGGSAVAGHAAKDATTHLSGDSVAVYALNPDFVSGKAGAPVAQAGYVATKAVSATGQTASVWSLRTADGWKVVNIASGSDETDYAARAGGDGTAFREPQVNAWYVLRGDRVLPLNAEAKATVGAAGESVAAYYAHVHSAYGDKLPGSSYARKGYAGGFGTAAAEAAAGQKTTAASTTASATASAAHGPGQATTTAALAGTGALLGLTGVLARRRLRRR